MSPLPKGLKTGQTAKDLGTASIPGLITGVTAPPSMERAQQPKAKPKPKQESHLESGFLRLWLTMYPDMPQPRREYYFDKPRMWRLDFAWLKVMVTVEIEGGMFKGNAHQRGVQYTDNCRKYNAAVMRGWRLLRYTTLDLRERPLQVVEEVALLINETKET